MASLCRPVGVQRCGISRFYDIYSEAWLGFTYGFLDANNGNTFTSTFQKAFDNNSDIVQIITWNDFGEGTSIEPTIEYGYQYLEIIQILRKTSIDMSFAYTSEDLLILWNFTTNYKMESLEAENVIYHMDTQGVNYNSFYVSASRAI